MKSRGEVWANKWRSENSAWHCRLFSFAVLGVALIYTGFMLLTRSQNINAYFITDHTNTAMDYFNMLSNLQHGDPWYENANYPALPFLFWKVMLHLVPLNEIADGYTLRMNMVAQLGYILFAGICLLMIWEAMRSQVKGNTADKILFSCAIMFSGPMMFLLERGNILLAVLAFSMMFLVLYDSPKLLYRIIAYACLAIAAGIKIYPAIFGLLVLWRKRYKEALVLFVLGAVIFLAPFFVFDGIESVRKMLFGIAYAGETQTTGLGFGYNFSMSNFVRIVAAMQGTYLETTPKWIPITAAIFAILACCLSKTEWMKLFSLVMVCIWFPAFSYTYTLVLLFLPIVSFFCRSNKDEQGRFRILYGVGFALVIIPYFLPLAENINVVMGLEFVRYPVSWGGIIINSTLVVVMILIAIEGILNIIKRKARKDEEKDNFRNDSYLQ